MTWMKQNSTQDGENIWFWEYKSGTCTSFHASSRWYHRIYNIYMHLGIKLNLYYHVCANVITRYVKHTLQMVKFKIYIFVNCYAICYRIVFFYLKSI